MKTPEIDFLEHMLGAARLMRACKVPEVALLAVKEEKALMARLERAMKSAAADHPHGAAALQEVGA